MASNMNQSQREFDDSFSRSKNWMFLIGSGYVISGLVSKDEKNKNLEIGLSTIFLTYIILINYILFMYFQFKSAHIFFQISSC